MSQWKGSARTNFFKVIDIDGLREALAPFTDIEIEPHYSAEGKDYYSLSVSTSSDYGGFPNVVEDENGQEHEFSFEDCVMPFVTENEVVIVQEVGAEKLLYLTGSSYAYIRQGDEVKSHKVSIDDIYTQAAEKFGLMQRDIGMCNYMDLPQAVTEKTQERSRP